MLNIKRLQSRVVYILVQKGQIKKYISIVK
jgi:hypothetical protein